MGTLPRTGRNEVVVDAPVAAVWDVVVDVTRTGEWSHECQRVEWLDGAHVAKVGARFVGRNRAGRFSWSRRSEIVRLEPGREIVLRAEMNVLVVIANCPHVLDPRAAYTVTPLRVTAWRGAATEQGDAIRLATPEGLRAYENVEAYFSR